MMTHAYDTEDALTAGLRAVAAADAGLRASATVEARLLAEVRAVAVARRRRTFTVLAVAAVLLIAAAVPVYRLVARPTTAVTTAAPTAASTEVTTAFLPLAYSSAPTTDGQLVRLEVPRAALAAFELSPLDSAAMGSTETVLADVLVGEDGLARAVRFVRPSTTTLKHEEQP